MFHSFGRDAVTLPEERLNLRNLDRALMHVFNQKPEQLQDDRGNESLETSHLLRLPLAPQWLP
jgi:hypothetical protein